MNIPCLALRGAWAIALIAAQTGAEAPPKDTNAWMAPASAARIHKPTSDSGLSVPRGKVLFEQNCLPCHGAKGNGDGPAAAFLNKHPGVLSDPKMWNQSDKDLFWKITHGRTPMPSFRATLTDGERWQVINYVRTLAPKPAGYTVTAPVEPKPGRAKAMTAKAAAENPDQASAARQASVASAAELQSLRLEIQTIKETQSREIGILKDSLREDAQAVAQHQEENAEALAEITQDLNETKAMAKDDYAGSAKLLLVGYGTAGLSGQRVGDEAIHPVFDAAFNPLFLWKISDRLLFEGEIELQMEGNETTVNLEVAQSTYLLNDYLSLGAGKFLNPMNFFVERQHMNWVNKLPDKPLAVYDGLLPESEVGMQIRGVVPLKAVKLEYAAFLVNAPMLITDDSAAFGSMEFDNFDNANGNLAMGGHIGFIPIPQIEIGYGMQTSEVGPAGTNIRATFQSLDVNCIQDADGIKGILSLRSQWVWSNLDRVTYDPNNTLGFGPYAFDNFRQGGYMQLAYRPSKLKNKAIQKLEPVVRYDALYQRKTPVGYDEVRVAMGLDYWIMPNVVCKGAYEIDRQNGTGRNGNTLMSQFITGF